MAIWHNTNWGVGDPVKTVRAQEPLRIQQPSVIQHLAKVESRTRLLKVVAKFIALLVKPMTSFQSLDSSKKPDYRHKKARNRLRLQALLFMNLVGMRGFEPPTPDTP